MPNITYPDTISIMSIITLPLTENNHLYTHIVYKDLFSPEECQKIINFSGMFTPSGIYGEEKESVVNASKRASNCKYINVSEETGWLFHRLVSQANEANKQFFNFIVSKLEGTQVIEYKPGGFHDWHLDMGKGNTSTRKLSIILFLSDNRTYEGGRVAWNPAPPEAEQQQGTMVIFPSYILHTVQPVTKGVRYSLVSWMCGSHFR